MEGEDGTATSAGDDGDDVGYREEVGGSELLVGLVGEGVG